LFIPVIEEVPRKVEVCGPDPDYAVVIPLAASDDGYRLVALEVRLLPYEWEGSFEHEFKFSIAVLDEDDEQPFRVFDRDMAKGYLPHEVRHLILPCVGVAIEALVRAVQPEVICRVTHASRPPDKALRKHHMVTDTLVGLGFRVQETGTDRFGRQFWRMSRKGEHHGEG
jgi:hypothetical protein